MINEITLIGNVGADPEIVTTQAGNLIAKISVATEENWRNRNGEWQSRTEWHKVICFGFPAEYAEKYIRKGQQVYVNGAMHYDSYTDRENITRYTAEVKAKKIKILGRKSDAASPQPDLNVPSTGDDVPF